MLSIYILIILCVLYFCTSCLAEIIDDEIDTYTVDELLALRDKIDLALFEKGYTVFKDISHGDKGDDVVKLQETLQSYGYYNGKINGKYDTVTEKAVKLFQRDYGLEVNGIATRNFQAFLYSLTEDNIIKPSTSPTTTPQPTLDPVLAEYEAVNYDEYARYPEKYKGKKVALKGKVLQVMGTKEKEMQLRMDVTGGGDVVYVTINKGTIDFNVLEGDRLAICGVLDGMYSYISTFFAKITIPSVRADIVTLR